MPEPKKTTKDEEAPKEEETPVYKQGETIDGVVASTGISVAPRDLGKRFRVLRGGLTGSGGASYSKGDEVSAEQVGDAARVQKLLERGSIEEVK